MKFQQLALLGAASLAVAQPHGHSHGHIHIGRPGGPVKARDAAVVTETAPGPVVTVYELNGQNIAPGDVEKGIKEGKYILIGETAEPTSTVAPSTYSPSPVPTSTSEAAQFIEKESTSETPTSTYVEPTTSAAPPPSSTSEAPAPPPSSSPASAPSAGTGGTFKSGTVPCSEFPSEYGAVPADWLGLGGWTGIQEVPDFNFGIDRAISYISTAISGGNGCHPKSFCSYACPAGQQKAQWPKAQGSTGQSIGGLYCNADGFLELADSERSSELCEDGTGGVEVTNSLSKNVCVCRTDYPGTESETVALNTQPGQTYPLTCPDARTYYQWENAGTSAQYYINPSGLSPSEACIWGEAGSNAGNWAPVNAGVGKGLDGVTYISLFPNAPTNPDGVLNFDIKITGDVSGDCKYTGGKYYNNGVESPTGCTVGIPSGGNGVFEFYNA